MSVKKFVEMHRTLIDAMVIGHQTPWFDAREDRLMVLIGASDLEPMDVYLAICDDYDLCQAEFCWALATERPSRGEGFCSECLTDQSL